MISLGEWANQYLDYCKQRFSRNRYKGKTLAFRLFFLNFLTCFNYLKIHTK